VHLKCLLRDELRAAFRCRALLDLLLGRDDAGDGELDLVAELQALPELDVVDGEP
jgi:hypothetical protein